MKRCVIYHRVSLHDLGRPWAPTVDKLRRFAAIKNLEVAGEFVDEHPRHDGPRPNLEAMSIEIRLGRADVVIVDSLHRIFRSSHHMMTTLAGWLSAGIDIVAVEDAVDTMTTEGRLEVRAALELLRGFEMRRHSEATTVGIIRARMQANGEDLSAWGGALTKIPVNKLEIKSLLEEGKNGRWLSQRAIVAEIKNSGGQMSKGTLSRIIRELKEDGMLDLEKREALCARSGANRGGRPPVRISYDEVEIRALRAKKLGPVGIIKRAHSLPKRAKPHHVRRILAELGI